MCPAAPKTKPNPFQEVFEAPPTSLFLSLPTSLPPPQLHPTGTLPLDSDKLSRHLVWLDGLILVATNKGISTCPIPICALKGMLPLLILGSRFHFSNFTDEETKAQKLRVKVCRRPRSGNHPWADLSALCGLPPESQEGVSPGKGRGSPISVPAEAPHSLLCSPVPEGDVQTFCDLQPRWRARHCPEGNSIVQASLQSHRVETDPGMSLPDEMWNSFCRRVAPPSV